jgi:hypothetical protein
MSGVLNLWAELFRQRAKPIRLSGWDDAGPKCHSAHHLIARYSPDESRAFQMKGGASNMSGPLGRRNQRVQLRRVAFDQEKSVQVAPVRVEKHDIEGLNRIFCCRLLRYFTNSSKCWALILSRPGTDRFQPNSITFEPIVTLLSRNQHLISVKLRLALREALFGISAEARQGAAASHPF